MGFTSAPVPLHSIKTKEMRPLGFDILDLVRRNGREYDSTVPHRHTFYELFFFAGGQGVHEIDFEKHKVEGNSVHFVCPGQIHRLALKEPNGYVVCFTEDFVPLSNYEHFTVSFPFYDNPQVPYLRLDSASGSEITELLANIAKEKKKTNFDPEIIRSYLNIVLLKLRAFYSRNSNEFHGREKKVDLFRKLVNSDFLKYKQVSDYAQALNVSPNHLNALCKKHLGRTTTQLIQERFVLESKRLLYATDMQIKEISFYLQFEDVPYFTKFFKKHTGLTPIQYRQSLANNR